VSLREPIDCRTQYGVWPQDQDFALRIVVAGDLAGDDPFSVDKFALLHIAESDILWPRSRGGEVDPHAATSNVILVGTGRNKDGSRFERRLGRGCRCS